MESSATVDVVNDFALSPTGSWLPWSQSWWLKSVVAVGRVWWPWNMQTFKQDALPVANLGLLNWQLSSLYHHTVLSYCKIKPVQTFSSHATYNHDTST